jgi:hypothetical protein
VTTDGWRRESAVAEPCAAFTAVDAGADWILFWCSGGSARAAAPLAEAERGDRTIIQWMSELNQTPSTAQVLDLAECSEVARAARCRRTVGERDIDVAELLATAMEDATGMSVEEMQVAVVGADVLDRLVEVHAGNLAA